MATKGRGKALPPNGAESGAGAGGGAGGEASSAVVPVPAGVVLCAILAVAATYVYFLIFAEFALLELIRPVAGEARLRPLMGALGAGGVLGGLLAARAFGPARQRALLAAAFLTCASAAFVALNARAPLLCAVAAASTGLGCGMLTVLLARVLGSVLPARSAGLCIGAGTGLAYALCNLPMFFAATPAVQAFVAALVAFAGALLASRLKPVAGLGHERPCGAAETLEPGSIVRTASQAPGAAAAFASSEHTPGIAWLWVLVLGLTVWLDSAAFWVIQHSAALRRLTWEGGWVLWGNAATHLFGALLAGWLVDRGQRALTALLAAAGLIIACVLLSLGSEGPAPRLLYTTGVSLYSTLLVIQAAGPGGSWQTWRLFALAGWVASALGIGMAQDLSGIPVWFPAVAAVGIGAGLLLRRRRLAALQVAGRACSLLLVFGVGLLALGVGAGSALAGTPAGSSDSVLRGREVYIAEGCMHCHSQFVRPKAPLDVERWGPASTTPLPREPEPPLPGNRRQGPDLTNVANRRAREWQRHHLLEPGAITPHSRMPAYPHLFEGEGAAGEDLLDYLCSLGVDTAAVRRAQVAAWTPPASVLADPALGARLYRGLCSNCHGEAGTGDGHAAPRLSMRPADLRRRPLLRVPPALQAAPQGAPDPLVLARVVKFGVEGTLMAGHEYLSDCDVVSLVAFISALQSPPPAGR